MNRIRKGIIFISLILVLAIGISVSIFQEHEKNQAYQSVEEAIRTDKEFNADKLLHKFEFSNFAIAICEKGTDIYTVYIQKDDQGWRIIHNVYKQNGQVLSNDHYITSSKFDDIHTIVVSSFITKNSDFEAPSAVVSDSERNSFKYFCDTGGGAITEYWVYVYDKLPENYKVYVNSQEVGIKDYKIDYVK